MKYTGKLLACVKDQYNKLLELDILLYYFKLKLCGYTPSIMW